jgi:hypothetical protein
MKKNIRIPRKKEKPEQPVIISSATSMSWSSTSDECKECFPEKLNKERMKSNLKNSEAYQKETLICR